MTRSSKNELYEYMHSFILSVMLGSSPLIRSLEIAYIDLRFHLAALSNDWRDLVSRVAISDTCLGQKSGFCLIHLSHVATYVYVFTL